MTQNNRILASLCYFSILLIGIVFPLIMIFVADDAEVKKHAKRALISHIIPFASLVVVLVVVFAQIFSTGEPSFFMFPALIIVGVIGFIITIWNIIQGILVLKGPRNVISE